MINKIDFTKNGGYRFKQFTLRKMQEAYESILKAFVSFCNVPEAGSFIISGMKINGANITSGYAYIDGELCKFEQTAGTLDTKIKKNVVIQSLGFKNGNNENVFRFVNAQVDETGVELSDFVRVSPVFDANYVHTDNNFTDELKTKLEGIEDEAEVNVQADLNESNPLSDSYVRNKPNGRLLTALMANTYIIGNIAGGNDDLITVTFPNIGTTNYQVLCEFTSGHANGPAYDNDFSYVIDDKTATSFKICFNEISTNHTQNITLTYTLIPLP
jgi:hypothetical protein